MLVGVRHPARRAWGRAARSAAQARDRRRAAARRFIEHENLHFDGFTAFCRSRSRLQRPLRGLGGRRTAPHARRDVRRGHREVRPVPRRRAPRRHPARTPRTRRTISISFRRTPATSPRRLRVSRLAFRVGAVSATPPLRRDRLAFRQNHPFHPPDTSKRITSAHRATTSASVSPCAGVVADREPAEPPGHARRGRANVKGRR